MDTTLFFSSAEQPAAARQAELKRLVNCVAVDVNQLAPLKYRWAWEHYLNGCANHWMPSEVPMARDIELWRSDCLTPEERTVILRNLGFFSTAESLVANNLVLAIYRQIPAIAHKDEFEMRLTEDLLRDDFSTRTTAGLQRFLENLVGFYVIMEGIFFYSGFAMILSFHRQNRMTGIGEQFQYILRDETIHLNFGIDLINGIKEENPQIWTPALQERLVETIRTAVDYEAAYAEDCLPRGIAGLNAGLFREYVAFVADRRLERIGLPAQYRARNPFPWMSETIDLGKEKNFFETRVTEYQSGGTLSWH